MISKKKKVYPIREELREYLINYGREQELTVNYDDLLRFQTAIPLYDKDGNDTLWSTVIYSETEMMEIYEAMRKLYALLKARGNEKLMRHLYIERIDVCEYGNTVPFRVKIVNKYNENYDYFYIKRADASRVYGLELENILSPNKVTYLVHQHTLVEEHIPGIPGEVFIKKHLNAPYINEVRLAKEFVKFNERCFVRLLGDMHCNNFVIEITPDFDDTIYRIRAIDFDQQSYEKHKRVYLPQFFKENNPIIQLGMKIMTPETTLQYQKEEHYAILYRMNDQRYQLKDLMDVMIEDEIAPYENVVQLRYELYEHYQEPEFLNAQTMGEIVKVSLKRLVKEY